MIESQKNDILKLKNTQYNDEEEINLRKKDLSEQQNFLSQKFIEFENIIKEIEEQKEQINKDRNDITVAARRLDESISLFNEKQKGFDKQKGLIENEYKKIEKLNNELSAEKLKIEQEKSELQIQSQNLEMLKIKLNAMSMSNINNNKNYNDNYGSFNNTFLQNYNNTFRNTKSSFYNHSLNDIQKDSNDINNFDNTQIKPIQTMRNFNPENKTYNLIDEYYEKIKNINKNDRFNIEEEKEYLRQSRENYNKNHFK